jgi:hypothetical protein
MDWAAFWVISFVTKASGRPAAREFVPMDCK